MHRLGHRKDQNLSLKHLLSLLRHPPPVEEDSSLFSTILSAIENDSELYVVFMDYYNHFSERPPPEAVHGMYACGVRRRPFACPVLS